MKTLEQKAKAYDEAVINGSRLWECGEITRENYEYIFPEFKESEDKKIRNFLIDFIKVCGWSEKQFPPREDCIAWLEKQGSEIEEHNFFDDFRKTNSEVEPKFKVGQWVVWQNKCYKVNYNGCGYELVDQNGLSTSLEYGTIDENARLWDIAKDAKDGDVLVCIGKYGQEIGIIKEYVGKYGGCDKCFETYCFVDWDGIFGTGEYMGSKEIHPATKEQRDTLMKAMADAGYTFDFDKKELKKIEQKLAWSEEDENMYRKLHNLIYTVSYCDSRKEFSDWLKSLKDRVQPKQEWSEEDESYLNTTIAYLKDANEFKKTAENCINWLKSLRPQNKWKPSDEQMKALLSEVEGWKKGCPKQKVLESLYNDLKKL